MLRTAPNMAKLILAIFTTIFLTPAFGQVKPQGTYIGIEPIKGCTEKWYHLTAITFKGDSVFVEQSPIVLRKRDTLFSASDGGFYSYAGTIQQYKGRTVASLTLVSCDYCPQQMVRFTPPLIIDDYDTTGAERTDTLPNAKEPAEMENPALKYKTLIIDKAKATGAILVNNRVYKRRER